MTVDELARLTRQRLAGRRRRVVPSGPLVQAAVLLAILDRGEARLVFAKRTEWVAHHRGQVSFPGGIIDP
ncbi:MAG: CoA pyrophosphatase, partial [Candidatus Rokuibacteriota bacterium]